MLSFLIIKYHNNNIYIEIKITLNEYVLNILIFQIIALYFEPSIHDIILTTFFDYKKNSLG